MLTIRKPSKSEINLLRDLPPEDWNLDLPVLLSFHFDYPYFYPVIAEVDNKIAGFGNGILNGNVGWIGNIIVSPEHRKHGLGYGLTSHLVEYFKYMGCTSQLLIASHMGKNVYTRIGFTTTSTYQFYKFISGSLSYNKPDKIRLIREDDHSSIKDLDKKASGEERFHLIQRFLPTGYVYSGNDTHKIQGFYLPDLGGGLVVADNPEAGLGLLKFRASQGKRTIVIPSQNTAALEFVKNEGYQFHQELPRMVIGEELNWRPEYVFNRGAGYCG